jgi:hypothetical protein
MTSARHAAGTARKTTGPVAPKGRISAAALARERQSAGVGQQAPPPGWWAEVLPGLLKEWGAIGAYIGRKTVAGRRRAQLSLVVQTPAKGPPARGSGVRKVPAQVRWRDGRSAKSLVTDVVECTTPFELQAGVVFGPGDTARFGSEFSTLGAAVSHPTAGRCLITAGHLLPPGTAPGTTVQVAASGAALATRLRELRQDGSIDYALLEPATPAPLDNLVGDLVRIGPVYTPTRQDVNVRVRLVRSDGNFHDTVCLGVNHQFTTEAGTRYDNTIITEPISAPGDSGGALVDHDERVWGFLLGARPNVCSVFVPAYMVLYSAGVLLA